MNVAIRTAIPADVEACGRIMHKAFKSINERHGFENTDFPTVEVGCQVAAFYIHNPLYYGVNVSTGVFPLADPADTLFSMVLGPGATRRETDDTHGHGGLPGTEGVLLYVRGLLKPQDKIRPW